MNFKEYKTSATTSKLIFKCINFTYNKILETKSSIIIFDNCAFEGWPVTLYGYNIDFITFKNCLFDVDYTNFHIVGPEKILVVEEKNCSGDFGGFVEFNFNKTIRVVEVNGNKT